MAQGVIQEEVVQLVGADKVFRNLLDGAVALGGNEFGTDGRIDNVLEEGRTLFVGQMAGHVVDQMLDERFGHGGIDAIHAHVVAVERCPAECKFAEISCSDHEASHLSRGVHENLGALSSL